ncbi:hypothetical protein NCER_100999 [Vairimorpha ceranae BRL01]|uniref:Uncharacterized protein n=2 Tax=Vairimorpha ceranae TaxID=40302 RepID=C4V8Z1_VAIC1|nr:hypothetical protein NCER_100999 [Vairimorpha ceranae BRL01]
MSKSLFFWDQQSTLKCYKYIFSGYFLFLCLMTCSLNDYIKKNNLLIMIFMRDVDPSSEFYELMEKDEIIIFEDHSRTLSKMCRYMSEETCKICVKNFPLLKRRLMFDFNINTLPVAFYYSHMILSTDNIKKCINEVNQIKYDLLEQKVLRLINRNIIQLFIEGVDSERSKVLFKLFSNLDIKGKSFGYYDTLLNKRIRNYICDTFKCKKLPIIFIDGDFIGTLEVFQELVVQKKIDQILNHL